MSAQYLLDTAVVTAYLQGVGPVVDFVSTWLDTDEAATSILVYGEAVEYLASKPDFPRRQTELQELMEVVTPYVLTYRVMDRYASLRRALRKPYGPGLIGDIDTLIAATALERGLTVVTTDGDFRRVPNLPLLLLDRYTFEERAGPSS